MNKNQNLKAVTTAALLVVMGLAVAPNAIAEEMDCSDVESPTNFVGTIVGEDTCAEGTDPTEAVTGPAAGVACTVGDELGEDGAPVSTILQSFCEEEDTGPEPEPEPECTAEDDNETHICADVAAAPTFTYDINDSGAGLDLGSITAGQAGNTADTPVNITFETKDANETVIELGQFQNETAEKTFDAGDGSRVCVYANEADIDENDLDANSNCYEFDEFGIAEFNFADLSLGGEGSNAYLVFEVYVPEDTQAGSYKAGVDIALTEE